MKKMPLIFLVALIAQMLVAIVPFTPTQEVKADHLYTCADWNCGTEIAVVLSNPDIDNATIEWRRSIPINICNDNDANPANDCQAGFEYDSGTLVPHSDGTPHYHSVGLLVLDLNDTGTFCDAGSTNDIVFSINGQPNSGTVNICSQWAPVIVVNLDLPEDQTTGTADLLIDDENDILTTIQATGLDCSLTSPNGSVQNCDELISQDIMAISGTTLTLFNLEEGEYGFLISYEEVCPPVNCDLRDLISFPQVSATFTIVKGETTNRTILVQALRENDPDSNRQVPATPTASPLPCESPGGLNPLEWLVCPIANVLFWGIDAIYKNLLIPFLVIEPLSNQGTPGTPEAALFAIWNNFRVIANSLFILIFWRQSPVNL